ncbi:MAG: class I SAM-dependent methyltransferase [Actinomycetota bacterium]|nr:class I SAM-dependent methyltransferase [Actinomycetota bacterium]
MTAPPDFDRMYAADADPFRVEDSWYERRKIAVVLAALAADRYRRSWDAACGTGHLVASLANRSDQVLASDASAEACRISAQRLHQLSNVQVRPHALPAAPDATDRFDLVLLSEVVYYLPPAELDALAPMISAVAYTDRVAELMVVNWRHFPADAYLSGTDAVAKMDDPLRDLGWHSSVRHEDEEFVLHSWRRPAGAVQ